MWFRKEMKKEIKNEYTTKKVDKNELKTRNKWSGQGRRTENKMDIKKKEESRMWIRKGERTNDKKRMKIRKTKE